MSDHVPLARIPGKLSAGKLNAAELNAAAEPGTGVTWNPGTYQLWHVYFAICVLGVLALTALAGGGESIADRRLAAGLIGAMSVWYAVFGRHLIDRDAPLWQGLLFQGVLFVLFFTAMYAVGVASFLLFGLCPLVYMTLHTWVGHGVVALYAFAPTLLALAFGDPTALGATLPLGAVIFGISVVIAVTTARMERVSAERGHLIEELNETRAEVARLSREAGIADERQRLAGEIHDTVAQGLSSVVMLVEAADAELVVDVAKARAHLALAARTARENLDEARAIVAALTPAPLAGSTLVDAIDRLSGRHGSATTAVSYRCDGEPRPLPTSAEVVLLRVAQESLTNAGKHAAAAQVTVRLHYEGEVVVLQVDDDGRGFDVGALRHGYGLDAMRARVQQLGGRLTIRSAPGKGTTVRTEIDA